MNHRKTGTEKEELAQEFLTRHGVRILFRNYHFHKIGEIDLIGIQEDSLLFVEVKYRKDDSFGLPEEAVNGAKQMTISRVATGFLCVHPEYGGLKVRFDVIAIDKKKIKWIWNAFPYRGKGF